MTFIQEKKCLRNNPWNDGTKYAFNLDHLLREWILHNHITLSTLANTKNNRAYQPVVDTD